MDQRRLRRGAQGGLGRRAGAGEILGLHPAQKPRERDALSLRPRQRGRRAGRIPAHLRIANQQRGGRRCSRLRRDGAKQRGRDPHRRPGMQRHSGVGKRGHLGMVERRGSEQPQLAIAPAAPAGRREHLGRHAREIARREQRGETLLAHLQQAPVAAVARDFDGHRPPFGGKQRVDARIARQVLRPPRLGSGRAQRRCPQRVEGQEELFGGRSGPRRGERQLRRGLFRRSREGRGRLRIRDGPRRRRHLADGQLQLGARLLVAVERAQRPGSREVQTDGRRAPGAPGRRIEAGVRGRQRGARISVAPRG